MTGAVKSLGAQGGNGAQWGTVDDQSPAAPGITTTNPNTQQVNWDGFSLGKIPTDKDALRIELRRSYAGVDQEMLRQMAEKEQKARESRKNEDANKQPKERTTEGNPNRREFTIVEQPLTTASTNSNGMGKGGAKGNKANPEDLFDQAMELSNSFNESGATFKV